jgi:N-acetylneuraminate synthase
MTGIQIGRPVGAEHPPYIIAAIDCLNLYTIEAAVAAIDAAADCRCDAVKFTAMRWAWAARLFEHAERRGLGILATPLDDHDVARLDWLGIHAYHLFFDWSDLELVARAARTGKPIVMSVGHASRHELAEVVEIVRVNGPAGIALVQTVLDVDMSGLDVLRTHVAAVGIADCTDESDVPVAAVGRGASIIELASHAKLGATVRECEAAWASAGVRRWTVN